MLLGPMASRFLCLPRPCVWAKCLFRDFIKQQPGGINKNQPSPCPNTCYSHGPNTLLLFHGRSFTSSMSPSGKPQLSNAASWVISELSGHFCLGSHDAKAKKTHILGHKKRKWHHHDDWESWFMNGVINIAFRFRHCSFDKYPEPQREPDPTARVQTLKNVASVELSCVTGDWAGFFTCHRGRALDNEDGIILESADHRWAGQLHSLPEAEYLLEREISQV